MAAGRWKTYYRALDYLADGTLDLNAAAWKVALCTAASNANTLSLTDATYADLTGELPEMFGYITGGQSLTGVDLTRVDGGQTFTASDAVWTAMGGSLTARYAVIYRDATVNAVVKPLLCVCLLDTAPDDVTATDTNTLTIQMHASGILTVAGASSD
jgi:hypothetical protein